MTRGGSQKVFLVHQRTETFSNRAVAFVFLGAKNSPWLKE